MGARILSIPVVLATVLGLTGYASPSWSADVSFYGDVYIPVHVLDRTTRIPQVASVFDDIRPLLKASLNNVVNLEGPVTTAFVPHEPKRFLLKMPAEVPFLLKAVGINVATLANNHSMDFGYQGVFDTIAHLEQAGIEHTGAGANSAAASRPVRLAGEASSYCVLAFSKTLPESFWSQATQPGTAAADPGLIAQRVEDCVSDGLIPIVTFHWGRESSSEVQDYQRALAHLAIDHGARAVLGHHPHVLQGLEVYKGRPIIYSLGNFAFGSAPTTSTAQGLGASLTYDQKRRQLALTLTPLMVDNSVIAFRPRPLIGDEAEPLAALMPAEHPCRYAKEKRHWTCLFKDQ